MNHQLRLDPQPFYNYIDEFDYMLRDQLVKVAILAYNYNFNIDKSMGVFYPISDINYIILDGNYGFLYSSDNLTDEEDDEIQEHYCMLKDNYHNDDIYEGADNWVQLIEKNITNK